MGIAESVADESTAPVLMRDRKTLDRILFNASRLGNRESLISYMFVVDQEGNVLGHTFSSNFPKTMLQHGRLYAGRNHGTQTLCFGDESAYDITYPVKDGGAQIGVVHVG